MEFRLILIRCQENDRVKRRKCTETVGKKHNIRILYYKNENRRETILRLTGCTVAVGSHTCKYNNTMCVQEWL